MNYSCNKLSVGRQFSGYLIVGTIATLVHFLVLTALVEAIYIHPTFASFCGFVCGGITGFTLNSRFVFQQQHNTISGIKYFVLAASSAFINSSIMHVLSDFFGIHYLLAQVFATGSVVIWNFIWCRHWVFKEAL